MSYALPIVIHLLSAVLWVGGMFFAYIILRPAAAKHLEPAQRLTLWENCFARFFPWVWVAVILLPASGYWLVYMKFDGLSAAPLYAHLMQALGIAMILIFLHVFFAPYRRLRTAVRIQDWPLAGTHLATIRKMVGINLLLGIIVIAIGSGGRYF